MSDTNVRKTSYTPGPWRYSPQVIPTYGFYIQTVDMSHKDSFIGDVGGGLQQPQVIEANAKLIAAAPELLEAVEGLPGWLGSAADALDAKAKRAGALSALSPKLRWYADKVGAAIAKAEGGTK